MSRKCKCKNCGKITTVDKAYKHSFLSDSLRIINEYYCDESCYEMLIKRKELKDDCYKRFNRILGFKVETNIYCRKMIKDIVEVYGYESIQRFLIAEEDEIIMTMDRMSFASSNNKISYFIAILQNHIESYKRVVKQEEEVAKREVNVEDDFEMPTVIRKPRDRKRKRRSLDDIFTE